MHIYVYAPPPVWKAVQLATSPMTAGLLSFEDWDGTAPCVAVVDLDYVAMMEESILDLVPEGVSPNTRPAILWVWLGSPQSTLNIPPQTQDLFRSQVLLHKPFTREALERVMKQHAGWPQGAHFHGEGIETLPPECKVEFRNIALQYCKDHFPQLAKEVLQEEIRRLIHAKKTGKQEGAGKKWQP